MQLTFSGKEPPLPSYQLSEPRCAQAHKTHQAQYMLWVLKEDEGEWDKWLASGISDSSGKEEATI